MGELGEEGVARPGKKGNGERGETQPPKVQAYAFESYGGYTELRNCSRGLGLRFKQLN